MSMPIELRYKPCKFFRATGTWDDDCCNPKSKNHGVYDIGCNPSLSEICETCPDYQEEVRNGL